MSLNNAGDMAPDNATRGALPWRKPCHATTLRYAPESAVFQARRFVDHDLGTDLIDTETDAH